MSRGRHTLREVPSALDADRRWRLYPAAVIAAVLLAVVFSAVTADGADSVSGRLGGDFVEFYGAGLIVADGDAQQLYEPARQVAAQAGLIGDDGRTGILFAYPPIVAAPYAPLSALDFRLAYLMHTAVMLGAFVLALRLLRARLHVLREGRNRLAAAAYALTFLPLFVGVTGGQNTALTLLALAIVWWGLDTDRPEWAGLAAGLLLVKPQYALTVIALLTLGRRWRALAGAAAGAAVVWSGSALVFGTDWVDAWLDLATSIETVDQGSNLQFEVSWLGMAQVVLGRESDVALVLGVSAAAVTALVTVWCLRRRSALDATAVAVALPALLLIAPHALYYDAGILVVAIGVLWACSPERQRPLLLVVCWLAGLSHALADTLGAEPVALLVVSLWLWAVSHVARSSPASGEPAISAPART